ncbi:N-acetyltransferase [Bombilactobacillus folatiphilus]|uniref:N-acetyltransferase n=1 Tax=Bombilactobacillus folatiphilus TaxID=2923362 RepID=A0ABY4PAZ0_9LACO|nr:N-acetyltransferase [Bombilactobacillus folatiphilus]UQS82770.1 N-acetyltransferase [Bombilactobacillus folatiphilus]
MLVKYNNNYQKIVMGFLSYIPELKDLDHVQMELDLYASDNVHQLFLYKYQNSDFIGIIALEVQNSIVMIRYISLIPAERSRQVVFKILNEIQEYYPEHKLMGTIELTPTIMQWHKNSGASV